MGLGVHELEFTTKYVKDCNEMADFTAYSSDEEIITVKSVREGLRCNQRPYRLCKVTRLRMAHVRTRSYGSYTFYWWKNENDQNGNVGSYELRLYPYCKS